MSNRGVVYSFSAGESAVPASRSRICGVGAMPDRVRAHDWASTPLGPIGGWPETLLSSVNTILGSRFPMAVFWGPQMIQLYNDAYLALIAEKHPKALGSPASETWKEAWHILGPRLEGTLSQGEATLQENVPIPILCSERIGDVYWTYSTSPIYSPEGGIAGVLTVCHDVTGEILARRDRRLISEQLNHVLDATTDGVVSLDRDYRFLYLNRRAGEILAPQGPVLGRDIRECFPQMVYENSPYVENYLRAMNEGLPGEFEAYYPEPLRIWMQVHTWPAKDGIVIFFRDITEQRRTQTAARENAARLDAIYNTSLEYIGLLSTDGKLLDCNRTSLEFEGNCREELLGKNYWECPWWAHTPGAAERLRSAIATAARGERVRYEMRLARPADEAAIFDFSLVPVRDASGEVVFLVSEARDITWIKRAELALKESEKLVAAGRLAASIAHEINNPLEAVTNLLYLASQTSSMDDLHGYLRIAEREVRRVSLISSQTLRFYRQSTNPRLAQCDELVESVLFIHHGRIVNLRVQVEQRLLARQPIYCFDGEIRQVLNNLIANAIDSMPGNGGRLLVRSHEATHWPTGRRGLRFSIADTGCGIRPENLRKIFEPFFTTKGASGTGLGLWVSQEIVNQHQGVLRVRSAQQDAKKSGTVFTLFLPFEPALRQSAA
jgi:PAS domain S-box-containing protein